RSIQSLFFFFQAEDGIRDFHVTGVQTCALPISGARNQVQPRAACFLQLPTAWRKAQSRLYTDLFSFQPPPDSSAQRSFYQPAPRSEERRVGKECRYRGAALWLARNSKITHSGVS